MTIKTYKNKKALGLAVIIEANEDGDGYAISSKKFDAENGAILPDEVITVSVIDLIAQKESLLSEIASIDEAIKDCNIIKANAEK